VVVMDAAALRQAIEEAALDAWRAGR
jgi:hypothetical protein